MSEQPPSKERDKTQDALGELYGWLIDLANQSSPYDSQMLMKAASIVGDRLATDSPISTETENLRRENVRWENAHKILLAENERLQLQLKSERERVEKAAKQILDYQLERAAPEPEPGPPVRPYGEAVAPAGPWRVVHYGSPPQKGDSIFDAEGCIAYFGDQHHEAVSRIVYEHNVTVSALPPHLSDPMQVLERGRQIEESGGLRLAQPPGDGQR